MPHTERERILRRVRSEYAEMPGLQLTAGQAQRLWGLDHETCREVLQELVASGFLKHGPDARYRRHTSDPDRRSQAKAGLRSAHSHRTDAA